MAEPGVHRVISDAAGERMREAMASDGKDYTVMWSSRPEIEVMVVCPPGTQIPEGSQVMLGPDGFEYDVTIEVR